MPGCREVVADLMQTRLLYFVPDNQSVLSNEVLCWPITAHIGAPAHGLKEKRAKLGKIVLCLP
jgi:hypothetical protein